MDEEAKAVQEVAKTTGKAIDGARELGGWIDRVFLTPIERRCDGQHAARLLLAALQTVDTAA